MSPTVDIYTRASRAGEGSTTHESQEREARAYAKAHGLKVGRVLRDDTKSSSATLNRPVLQEALRRVQAGDSNGVVIAYLSRASRNTVQGLEILDTIQRSGGAVYAPNLPDYTTPDGLMLTTIQLAIDTGYRDRKNDELENRKRESIANRVPVHTRAAVGLRKRPDKRLEHDPDTAPIIRRLFDLRAQGAGPVELAQLLEANGVKTSQGSKTWSKQAIYGLIENEIYKNVLVYGLDRRYVHPAAMDDGPVVDAATWEAAQHPNGRKLTAARSGDSSWLLTGIVRCQACRYALQGTRTSHGKRIYRCNGRHAAGICSDKARIGADELEAAAVELFWQVTADIEAAGHKDDSGELAALEAEYSAAQQRVTQLEARGAQDALGDRYLAVFAERMADRDRAAQELGAARGRAGNAAAIPDVETLRGAWERMTVPQRRELLGLRFHALALGRDRSLVVYPAGSDVVVPQRGFKQAPVLAPFPDPPRGARTLTL